MTGLSLVLALLIQDTQSGDVLQNALQRAAGAGALTIEGAVAQSSTLEEALEQFEGDPQMDWIRRIGPAALGPEGFFSGTISPSGDAALSLETEAGSNELYRRGGRTVQRRTWVQEPPPQEGEGGGDMERMARQFMGGGGAQGLGPESERILALSWLSDNYSSLMNIAEGTNESIGGHSCRVYSANAPEEYIQVERPEDQQPQEPPPDGERQGRQGGGRNFMRMFGRGGMGGPLEEVSLTFWVDAEDGSLRKYRVDVVRGEPEWFDRVRQFMDVPDEVRSTSSYEIEIQESGDAVTFPPEIQRYFDM